MADLPEWLGPKLTSKKQAIEVGYAEGHRMHEHGGKPEHMSEIIEIHFEAPYPDDRGRRNPFNSAWRCGFEAGYLGRPKPSEN